MKKEYRVKKGSEIEQIIKKRQSKGNKHFVLYKRENHGQSHFRFAVSVSKKFGNAVARNKIKRQVREIISKQAIVDHYDIFIVVKNSANDLSFAEIKKSLEWLIQKQNILRRITNEKSN
jgi:ribonuclease P protein component